MTKVPRYINPLNDYIECEEDDPQRDTIVAYNRALREAKMAIAQEHLKGEHWPKRHKRCMYCEPYLR